MTRALALVCAGCTLAAFEERAPTRYADVVLEDAPLSYWRFDDAGDALGRAQGTASAVVFGAPGAIASDPSAAASFDGASSVIEAPDVYAFTGTQPFTIEAWVAPEPGGPPVQRVCNHRFGAPHTGWRLFVDTPARAGESKRATFERWSGDVMLGSVSAPLAIGRYTHVVVRYDGASLELFLDGTQRDAARDAGPIAPFAAPLTWGAASTKVLDFYRGRIDEGAIYDHPLAPERIAAHYAAGARASF